MYSEKEMIKDSVPVFIALAIVIGIISLVLKDIALILGFVLGYVINLIIFQIIVFTVDNVLLFGSSRSNRIMSISYISKMIVYGFGFMLSINFPSIFNIITVTIGYFVLKLSIFYSDYRIRKRGEDV